MFGNWTGESCDDLPNWVSKLPGGGSAMRRQRLTPLMMLAVEANTVIALRMMKLMVGGRSARLEAERIVTEKADRRRK